MQQTDFVKGYTYILLSLASVTCFLLLADYLFRANPTIHPANLLFWSITGATILSSPYFMGIRKNRVTLKNIIQKDYTQILLIGGISFIAATLWNFALKESSAGILILLGKMTFIITIFLGIFFHKEKIYIRELGAIGLVLIGLIFIVNLTGEVNILAVVYTLLSCCCYAVLSLLIKNLGKEADMKSVAYLRAISISICLFVYLHLTGNFSVPNQQVLILGPISEIFGIILWAIFYFEAHRYLPISKLNVFSVADIIIVPFIAWIIFGDSLGEQKILGSLFIAVGILWFFREQVKLQKKEGERRGRKL